MSDPERPIVCSLCAEQVPSSAMRDHLMLCGNKTDPCPNCRKYIRRAIFTYHYENKCANVEADLTTYETAQENSDFSVQNRPTTTECPFCYHLCETGERDIHQKHCLQSPMNIARKSTSHSNPTSNDRNQLQRTEPMNDIPCEYCQQLPSSYGKPVDNSSDALYSIRQDTCGARYQHHIQEREQRTNTGYTTVIARHPSYNSQSPQAYAETHVMHSTYTSDARYRSAYNLPPLNSLRRSHHLNQFNQ